MDNKYKNVIDNICDDYYSDSPNYMDIYNNIDFIISIYKQYPLYLSNLYMWKSKFYRKGQYVKQDYDKSISLLESALELDPKNISIIIDLSLCYSGGFYKYSCGYTYYNKEKVIILLTNGSKLNCERCKRYLKMFKLYIKEESEKIT